MVLEELIFISAQDMQEGHPVRDLFKRYYRGFVGGKYQDGIHSESMDSVRSFEEMVRLGFLTLDSQEGRSEKSGEDEPLNACLYAKAMTKTYNNTQGYSYETSHPGRRRKALQEYANSGGKVGKLLGGWRYRERAYCLGLMPTRLAYVFCSLFNAPGSSALAILCRVPRTKEEGALVQKYVPRLPLAWGFTTKPGLVSWADGKDPEAEALRPVLCADSGVLPDQGKFQLNGTLSVPDYCDDLPDFAKELRELMDTDTPELMLVFCIDPEAGYHARAEGGLFRRVVSYLHHAYRYLPPSYAPLDRIERQVPRKLKKA